MKECTGNGYTMRSENKETQKWIKLPYFCTQIRETVTMMVFLLISRFIAFTSARRSAPTGARRSFILKYWAALSYAECALSAIILQQKLQKL